MIAAAKKQGNAITGIDGKAIALAAGATPPTFTLQIRREVAPKWPEFRANRTMVSQDRPPIVQLEITASAPLDGDRHELFRLLYCTISGLKNQFFSHTESFN
ncbi:hypothetical protein GCM10011349_43900 [Novosphingobium indicum]|uniref:Uncharacterized protein n=1 Tax=Novosphingobium indicum TaxID=462949 RepID=A0ABQ2K1P4_9SPHN|nr:hypothetical protein GCM10011349_43900 [Novosphingobium indicum]